MKPGLLLVAGFIACAGAQAQAQEAADTVFRNGVIDTVNSNSEMAEAVAVTAGVITYVGSNDGAEPYIGPQTKVVDLKGLTVMPGIHDGHIHGYLSQPPNCSLDYESLSVAKLQERVRGCLAEASFSRGPEGWLPVDSWYVQFTRPNPAAVTRATLDEISTERPIVVFSTDGHSAVANSKALALAGITKAMPDPADGAIERDAAGEPTGVLQDGAMNPIWDTLPEGPALDPVEAARAGVARFNAAGITSFYAAGGSAEDIAAYAQLAARKELDARAHFAYWVEVTEAEDAGKVIATVDQLRKQHETPLPRSVTDWRAGGTSGPDLVPAPGLSIDGIKMMLDGVLQYPAQTAGMLEPYWTKSADGQFAPGTETGSVYLANPVLGELVTRLDEAGYQAHLHAIGDAAVRTGLDAIAAMKSGRTARDSRPTLAHTEIVDPADLPRFAELGVTAVMSYQWAKPGPDSTDSVKDYLGPQRYQLYEPSQSIIEHGGRVAFGSDFPVDPLDQWLALEVAVKREADWGPEFPQYAGKLNDAPGISLDNAIRGMTIHSAHAMHQDAVTGSIEQGKLADLLVIDRNLRAIDPEEISETRLLMTMVGGKVVYRSPDAAALGLD